MSAHDDYENLAKKLQQLQKDGTLDSLPIDEVVQMLEEATKTLSKAAIPVANKLQDLMKANGFTTSATTSMALHMVAFSLYPKSVLFAKVDPVFGMPDPTLFMCEIARDVARSHVEHYARLNAERSVDDLMKRVMEKAKCSPEDLSQMPTDDTKH